MSHTALLALAAGFAEAENHVLTTLRECDCQIKGRYIEGEDEDDDEDEDEDEDVEERTSDVSSMYGHTIYNFKAEPIVSGSNYRYLLSFEFRPSGKPVKMFWGGKDFVSKPKDGVAYDSAKDALSARSDVLRKNEEYRLARRKNESFDGEPVSESEALKNLDLLYDVAADYITSEADSVLADVFAAYYNQNSEEHMFAVAKDIGAIKKSDFAAALKIAGVDKDEHQTAQHLKDGLFALTRQVVVDIMLDDDDDETPEPVAAMPTK